MRRGERNGAARCLEYPDTLIAELYRNEPSFRKWCQSTLFPAELAAFLETLLLQSERTAFFVSDVLGKGHSSR